jgi:cephalosporin hydroxylase
MKNLELIREYGDKANSDISSHLETIYTETFQMNPKLIVELGVRGGESSRAFSYVNEELGSRIIGVDVDRVPYEEKIVNGTLVVSDDCAYADVFKSEFGAIIDVLMIDTSHQYEHTKQEVAKWFPLLSNKALVIFHDTNLDGKGYTRKNGTIGENWNNERGVIRLIEEYFGRTYDETKDFEDKIDKGDDTWRLRHECICNGLTLCWKN